MKRLSLLFGRFNHRGFQLTSLRLVTLALVGVVACSGGGEGPSAPSVPELDPHQRLVVEPIPFDVLKSGTLVFFRSSLGGPGYGLVVVDVGQKRVTTAPQSPVSSDMAVSPDGRRVAFASSLGSGPARLREVFVKDISSLDATAIGGAGGRREYPSWNSAARLQYAESPDYAGGQERFVRRSPAATATDRIYFSETVPAGCAVSSPASTRQDGSVVFSVESRDTRCGFRSALLYLKGGGGPTTLQQVLPPTLTEFRSPVWAPDGDEVAFLEILSDVGGAGSLAVKSIRSDGSGLRTIVVVPGHTRHFAVAGGDPRGRSLCWMRGGAALVFTFAETPLSMHIYAVNRDGSGLTRITTDPASIDQWVSCAP